jgi:soluble lytic murein transglycosylase
MRRAAAALLAVATCRGGHLSEPPAARSSVAAPRSPSVETTAPIGDAGGLVAPADPPIALHMPRLSVVLDDPRLAEVRGREQAHDELAAARVFDVVRATVEPTLATRRLACSWDYLGGRLHLAAGNAAEAAAAFERVLASAAPSPSQGPADAGVPDAPCPLAPYAALHAAQALVRLGRYDDAIAHARAAGADIAALDDVQLVLADACAGKGLRSLAVPIWRALLAASPHGVRWVDSALQLATALLDGVDGPPPSHAQEAFDLATRVLVEAPAVADKVDVAGLRARAWSRIGRRAPTAAPGLSPEERAQQAQAWLDARQSRRAADLAEELLETIARGSRDHHGAACKAAIVRAQARRRGKAADVADAWGVAIARCEGDDALVTALYSGGKASASAHRSAESIERFGKVETLFPTHRLADDACLRAAVVACDDGDESTGLARLESLPDSYPDGDMGGEALFRVALAKIGKQDFVGARDVLDRMLAAGLDAAGDASGRGAYFRARVAQLAGDSDDAETRYAAILGDHPLGYYMLLARARLRAMNEDAAREAVEAGVAREPPGPLVTGDHPELRSAAFERFLALLEVGEIDSARREAQAGGLVADGVDPEVVWTVAWAYDRAGAPELGHALTRARVVDFRDHWPAGRWRLAWEVAYPRVWEGVVARESEATHVPAPLTWAIMREESAFNVDARSVADAIGLMQLIVPTARATASGTQLPCDEDSLRRPEVSIALGTRLLSSLRASFSVDPALAVAAYNGGSGAVRRWLSERGGEDFDVFVEHIPFEETRAYLKRVLSSEAAYAYLYAPKALDELFALPLRP